MYYAYLHIRLKDGSVFHAGKGKGNRILSHKGRNKYWLRIVKADGGFDYQIVEENLSENEAFTLEKKLVAKYNPPTNMTEGGSGGNTKAKYTVARHALWRERASKGAQGKIGYWRGKKRPQQSEALKNAHRDGAYGNYEHTRKTRTPKTVDKLGWPVGKRRQKIACEFCGIVVSTNNLKRHQQGSLCKGR